MLDFMATADNLGKPSGSDLKSGILTAPVLFAIKENPKILNLIGENKEESFLKVIILYILGK